MNANKHRKAQVALAHLGKKGNSGNKGRVAFNKKPTRECLGKKDNMTPTASMESIFLACFINACKGRDVMSADAPTVFIQTMFPRSPGKDRTTPTAKMESIFLACVINACKGRDVMSADAPTVFIQAMFPRSPGKDRTIMKIVGKPVDTLVNMHPEVHSECVALEKGKRVLHAEILKAICRMPEAALLWCGQFRSDIEEHGFVFNNYDPCVANNMINGKQQTVRFHADDLMSSHVDKKANKQFLKWLNSECR